MTLTSRDTLARTLLLAREYLTPDAEDEAILEALCGLRVTFAADRRSLSSRGGIDALVTSVLLCARSGAQIALEIDDVPLEGFHAPLSGGRLGPALVNVCDDLMPGSRATVGRESDRSDLRVLIGETKWSGPASVTLRACGDAWRGDIRPLADSPEAFAKAPSPFGPLAAAGLVAGEAFKASLRRLRGFTSDPLIFDELFAAVSRASVALAPTATPMPSGNLGAIDLVSGGAITQSALFVLGRIPNVSACGRVFEPEKSDGTNINRYSFLRRSLVGAAKADDVVEWFGDSGVRLTAVRARFDDRTISADDMIAPTVLVGVDHIPSRWFADAVARRRKEFWLGIGATTHYSAMASFHVPGLPCARCLHPIDDEGAEFIPTAAFVSHWAGLYLASLTARHAGGERMSNRMQSVFATLLRPDLAASVWWGPVTPSSRCATGCRDAA